LIICCSQFNNKIIIDDDLSGIGEDVGGSVLELPQDFLWSRYLLSPYRDYLNCTK